MTTEDNSSFEQMKKENRELRKALVGMTKVQAETATENLKLKSLLVENGVYFYGEGRI